MKSRPLKVVLKFALAFVLIGLLAGCELVLLNPAGDVAAQKGDLIIYATVLMLIIILPVMAMTVFFALHYRSSNSSARYEPDWDHSISLEVVIWAVPLAIVICLAGLTWVATHRLDPYTDLRRVSADVPIDPSVEPLTIQVVSMDWKWVFLYPELGIATVNEVASVVNRPVEFKLTSQSVMTAFYVPDFAGMIYTMAAMETELNGVLNEPGSFRGFASHYNGPGFSYMDFQMHAFEQADFDRWVNQVRQSEARLDRDSYTDLMERSINHPVTYYGSLDSDLWQRILSLCVKADAVCVEDLGGHGMLHAGHGGHGQQPGQDHPDLHHHEDSTEQSALVEVHDRTSQVHSNHASHESHQP
ncbi:MAG: ubiquinol oxidase subunit II [Pseudomonadota bacterium]